VQCEAVIGVAFFPPFLFFPFLFVSPLSLFSLSQHFFFLSAFLLALAPRLRLRLHLSPRAAMGPPTSEAAAAFQASQALSWSDEGKAVVVRVPLPSSPSPSPSSSAEDDDVVVDAGGGGLVVSLASSKKDLLRVVQLYGTIDASKVSKSVSRAGAGAKGAGSGGEVVVTLPKLDGGDESSARWPSLEASANDDGGDSSSSSGAAAALAEREHVAMLLTAAKEGDFEGLKAAAEKYRGDATGGGEGDGDDATKQSSTGVGAIKDGNGRSVLHFAVAGKNTACAEWLVDECGVNVNAMDDSSASPPPPDR